MLKISMKKLPVGYRLNPTDEDLVNHHLIRKLKDEPEEYCLIPEFDIYKLPPWDLITKFNDMSDFASDGWECFFFHRRNNVKGKMNNRRTKDPEGFWKPTGKGRDPQETDLNKWSKKYLVYHLGKQSKKKRATRTEWAMHEFKSISDQSVVVCRIHKKKPKNGKEKAGFVSSDADSTGSPITTTCSENLIEPREIFPEESACMMTKPQNLPLSPNIEWQKQIPAEGRLTPSHDTYNSLSVMDLRDPEDPQIFMREQSPPQTSTDDQSLNDMLSGVGSPLQPPAEMLPHNIDTPLNDGVIDNTCFQLDGHGQGSQVPVFSTNNGHRVRIFKETPHPTLDIQTTVSPPNAHILSPEQMKMLEELLTPYNTQPLSDCSEGESLNTYNLRQSPQTNLEAKSPNTDQDVDIEAMVDSLINYSQWEGIMGHNLLLEDGPFTEMVTSDYS